MKKLTMIIAACVMAGGVVPQTAIAQSGHSGHGAMTAPEGATEAEVAGVINSIDANSGTINVTHEPVEALGWPKMTMDLPVTRQVDLSTVRTGENVKFKQGRDKQFRVIEITPSQ